MRHPRPSAWALIAVLVISLFGAAGTATPAAAASQCTGWTDEFHPPTEIRVRRHRGPNAGGVDVVPFWNYVGTVLAAEYTTGGPRGPVWMRMGALSVKQYAWYYAMHWRGGTVTITNPDGSTTTECFDVKDSTADQIYKPEKLVDGVWVPANVPSAANLQAMAETWSMSLRKWVVKKQKSRLFLTGYRSGKKNPCGTDSNGFKIKQKSLGDCIVKGLDFEEALRRYFEPNLLIVDPRQRDILDDGGTWFGDVGVLSPSGGNTAWRIYAGLADGFDAPVTGTFAIDSTKIVGQGVGDVTGDGLSDLVMLLNSGTLRLAVANGTGYDAPATQDLPAGAPADQLVVGDFDGDLLADVGLLRSTPVEPTANEPATLVIMRGSAGGTFSAPADWWRGALDLSTQQAMAGDVNGDGRADLVIRDATAGVTFRVAPSFASCADPTGTAFSYWGPCTLVPGTGLDVAAPWLDVPGWSASEVKWTTSDFNRDGRSDIVALVKDGSDIDVFGAAATQAGAFGDARPMWQASNVAIGDVMPFGADINPDGLGDLALLLKAGTNSALMWLRATQSASVTTFVATTAYTDANLAWAPASSKPY